MAFVKAVIAGFIGLQFFVSCGPKLTQGVSGVVDSSGGSNLTEGVSDEGVSYTGFSPISDLSGLKDRVSNNSTQSVPQSAFRGDVVSIRKNWVPYAGKRTLAVTILFKNGKELKFVGPLNENAGAVTGAVGPTVLEGVLASEGSAQDVRINVGCQEISCNVLTGAFVTSDPQPIGGFILREEDRVAEESWEG